MRFLFLALLTLTVCMTSCGNIDDTDGKIGNEAKETENTESVADKAKELMEDASDAADRITDDMKGVVSSSFSEAKRITAEQAQSVAFFDAGKSFGEVTVYKSYLYNDDGREYYDVEFADNETMFEYEIDSVSADILKKERNNIK